MKRRLRSAFAPMVSAKALEEQKHDSTCRIVDKAKAAEPAMSLHGMNRTSRAGLAMSVDWGKPEVVDRGSKRRF
jgi:hypothetical protein